MGHSHNDKRAQTHDVADYPFPPSSWLGFGLDLTAISPNDINAVTEAIITAYSLIPLDTESSVVDVAKDKWAKPDNVDVAVDVKSGSSLLNSWADGVTAAKAIKADSSLSARYMAVSGDASVGYSVDSTFESDRSYSLFSYNQLVANVKFKSYGQSIDKNTLATAISSFNLQPFDPSRKDIVASYKNLFNVLGSHIVVGASYGGRFQMSIYASNKDSSYESSVTADLSVEYNGLCTSGKIDASVATQDQYKSYSREVMQQVSCRGGDVALGSALNSSYREADIFETYTKWVDSAALSPGVMDLETSPLWTVMAATFDPDILKYANDVKTAFFWIMENPAPHWTKGVVTINSDWGEFGITSPSAHIIQDPNIPPDPDNLIFTGTKIRWGKEHSHDFQRNVTISFIIVNDGSPLNFELSHGSDGSTGGNGRIDVDFNGNTYSGEGITDNNWNTKFYYNATVNQNEHGLTLEKNHTTDGITGKNWHNRFHYHASERQNKKQKVQSLVGKDSHHKKSHGYKVHHAE